LLPARGSDNFIRKIVNRLAWAAAAIVLVLAIGTTGFVVIDGYPVFDAFYMSLITIFTVGYNEIHELSRAGRVFNSFLIFFGALTLLLAAGAMTQTIIELELNQFFAKRRIKNMVDNLKDHFIVCGYGRVGRGAADELRNAGASFVIIDSNEDRVEHAMRNQMLAVLADCTRDEALRGVGIDRAKGLIATLGTDADNLFLILSARTLNPSLYLSARVGEEEASSKMKRAGADQVFAPYTSTGARMAQALLRPHVSQFLDFTTRNTGLNVGIEQVEVLPGSEVDGKTLEEIRLRRELGIIVLAIKRKEGQMEFNPAADARLDGGDFLIVMGEADNLPKLEMLLGASGK
jgi:voltage-gated potassium channel